MQKNRAGIAFQIITDRPEEISKELIVRLRHSATMLQGRGMYHGDIVSVLFCVVNREQQHALCEILQKYPQRSPSKSLSRKSSETSTIFRKTAKKFRNG